MKTLIPRFIHDQYEAQRFSGDFDAFTLFIDISGFTAMTETLMQHLEEGAETMSSILDAVFVPAVDRVYAYGGFIPVFAGDAFTAIFPVEKAAGPLVVIDCAQQLQQIFKGQRLQKTKAGDFELSAKIGLSRGKVYWGIAGGEQKAFFFRGAAVDGCAQAEHHAQSGEIVLTEALYNVTDKSALTVERVDRHLYRLKALKQPPLATGGKEELPALRREVVARFVPQSVLEFTTKGEFRHVASVLMSFDGFSSPAQLNDLVSSVLENFSHFSGYLKEIDFGDKGMMMVGFFGAPVSYEDNVARALDCLLSLKRTLRQAQSLAGLTSRAGITYGRAFTGFVGGKQREQYSVLGDQVNLAARFMMQADWGECWISKEVYQAAKDRYKVESLGKLRFKGTSAPATVFNLLGERPRADAKPRSLSMVGREEQIRELQEYFGPLSAGGFGGVVYVYGAAGIGKSLLVSRFAQAIKDQAQTCVLQADSILRKSLNPFTSFLEHFFHCDQGDAPADRQARFERAYDALIDDLERIEDQTTAAYTISELKRTKAVIGALLGFRWQGSLYEILDAKGRYENSLFALKELFKGLSLLKPTVILLEDLHWLDADSHSAFRTMLRHLEGYPLLLIATSRLNDDGTKPVLDLDESIPAREIVIGQLPADAIQTFTESRLAHKADGELLRFIQEKTQGNPFFIEQFCLYLQESDLLDLQNGTYSLKHTQTDIPADIVAIIISRVDRLSHELKEMVKIASVLGREVDMGVLHALIDLYTSAISPVEADALCMKLEQEQIWSTFSEIKYIFRHVLFQESIYKMQLKQRLRELHELAGRCMETLYQDNPTLFSEHYADLAHHYAQAENTAKSLEYLEKAAHRARHGYRNQQAIDLYEQLIGMLEVRGGIARTEAPKTYRWYEWAWQQTSPDEEDKQAGRIQLIKILLCQGEVLEFVAKWERAMTVYERAIVLAADTRDQNLVAETHRRAGMLINKQGDFDRAFRMLQQAQEIFSATGDRAGFARTTGDLGNIYSAKGDNQGALDCYKQAQAIFDALGDNESASIVQNNIGLIYEEQADYDGAMACYEQRRQVAEQAGDMFGLSAAVGNIGGIFLRKGEYKRALECFNQQLRISQSLGDKQSISIAAARMGITANYQGDLGKAIGHFKQYLNISREMGDKHNVSYALTNLAGAYQSKGEREKAMRCYQQALAYFEHMGDKKNTASVLLNIGTAYADKGRYDRAMEVYERSLALLKQLDDPLPIAIVIGNMGDIHHKTGDYGKAMACYEEKLKIVTDLGVKYSIALTVAGIAEVLTHTGEYQQALARYNEAVALGRELEINYHVCEFLMNQAHILVLINQWDRAKELVTEASAIAGDMGRKDILFKGKVLSAKIDCHTGRQQRATDALRDMLAGAEHAGDMAVLHYELFLFSPSSAEKEQHRRQALELYQKLYADTPNAEYQARIAELSAAE